MSLGKVVGDIEVVKKSGGITEGTGFLVGPNDLLTAAHVIHNGRGFVPAKSITVHFDGRAVSAEVIWKTVPGAYTGGQDWGDDMALLTLDKPLGKTLGWMGMSSRTDKHVSPINLAGYSHTPGSPTYDGDTLQTDYVSASYDYVRGEIGYTSADIHGGSSGGPAYWFGGGIERYAVGIHVAGDLDADIGNTANLLTAADIDFLKKLINNNGDGTSKTIRGTATADDLLGDARANRLYGKAGADELYGVGGSDRLFGGLGRDKLFGAAGDDYLAGGPGNDRLLGGRGTDTAFFSGKLKHYDVVRAGNTIKVIDRKGGTDTLVGIEKIKIGNKTMTAKKAIKAVGAAKAEKADGKAAGADADTAGAEAVFEIPPAFAADDLLV